MLSVQAEAGGSVGGVSLRELQRSLRADGVSESTISAAQVDELARRLEKVRSWGGAYAAIEFSPEIEALLARRKTVGGGIVELPNKSARAGIKA